jgi:hypothetical protein
VQTGTNGVNVCAFSDSGHTQQIGATKQTVNGEAAFEVPAGHITYFIAHLNGSGRSGERSVTEGASVALQLSLFGGFTETCPIAINIPNVTGQEQAAAQTTIVNANLTVGTVTSRSDPAVPAERVISQNPTECTGCAEPGNPVDLVISTGQDEPDPVVNAPELRSTPPNVTFPPLVMPLGTRVCQTVTFDLAPNRDTSKTIGLFVNKNGPLINGGVDVGWTDPVRMTVGAANDLAGPLEVLRTANGQVSHSEGQPITPFQICAEDWAGARVGTYTTTYSIADRSIEGYAPQTYFREGTIQIQVVAAVAPPPPDNPPPVDTATWEALKPAFQASSCVNCHSASAGNFPNLSPQHNQNVASAPAFDPGSCTGCHTDNLLPNLDQTTHDISWQAPPAFQDLRNLSDAQLCQRAQNFGSLANSVPDHLKGDVLILWAVQGGLRPNGTNAQPAFSSVQAWNNAVDAWVTAEMPCP